MLTLHNHFKTVKDLKSFVFLLYCIAFAVNFVKKLMLAFILKGH